MTLSRENAELSQAIDVASSVTTNTLSIPQANLVNVSGTITANTGVFDLVEFNNATEIVPSEGQLTWDTTYGTLDIGFSDTYALHVGQETHFRARNETGGSIYKGQAVYATGVHSDNIRLEIDKYTADGNISELRFIGLVSEDIGNNGSGYVTNFGYIRGNTTYPLDTRGNVSSNVAVGDETWAQGDILYVHPTTAGKLTKVEPQHSISVAIVIRVHQTDGVILVRPTSYGHLNDNHDVQINSPTTNDMLVYNSGSGVWINTQISEAALQGVQGTQGLQGITGSQGTAGVIGVDGSQGVQGIQGIIGSQGTTGPVAGSANQVVYKNASNVAAGSANFTFTETGTSLQVDNLKLDGNTLSSTNSNGNININPNGTGGIAGGSSSNVTSLYGIVAGGTSNYATGLLLSVVSGGGGNVSSATGSVISGGSNNYANTDYSTVVGGLNAKASRYGEVAHAAGNFAQAGDAQHSTFVARKNTTDATANVELFLAGSSSRMTLTAETTWTFSIKLSAYNDTDNTAAWWIIRGGIRRDAANGTALIGSLITERDYEGTMSGTSAAVTADDTNESLKIAVTGLAGKNIRWVAVVDVAQVSWGTP